MIQRGKQSMLRILCVTLLCCIWQCNNGDDEDNDPLIADEEDKYSQLALESFECQMLAFDVFKQHIQPAIAASCGAGNCHGSDGTEPPGGGLELLKGTDGDSIIKNRATMRSHRKNWLIEAGELLDKLTDVTHSGGNQVEQGHITEEGITAWVKAEQACHYVTYADNIGEGENNTGE